MNGKVQIFHKNKLLLEEHNLWVDGAGETLCDMFSINPEISGISSASAILDTSNYTIQAMAFGHDDSDYALNLHDVTDVGPGTIMSTYDRVAYGVSSTSTSSTTPVSTSIPRPANPRDKYLSPEQENFLVGVSGILVPSQIPNLYAYSTLLSSTLNPFPRSSAVYYGAFPRGSGDVLSLRLKSNYLTIVQEINVSGQFNTVSSMDAQGFVTVQPDETDPASGVIVSSSDAVGTGEVVYTVNIASGDLAMVHQYGGIHSIGLFTIDTKTSKELLHTAPFTFVAATADRRNNQRKYRLFAKKVFSINLTQLSASSDLTSYQDLDIVWTLNFQ